MRRQSRMLRRSGFRRLPWEQRNRRISNPIPCTINPAGSFMHPSRRRETNSFSDLVCRLASTGESASSSGELEKSWLEKSLALASWCAGRGCDRPSCRTGPPRLADGRAPTGERLHSWWGCHEAQPAPAVSAENSPRGFAIMRTALACYSLAVLAVLATALLKGSDRGPSRARAPVHPLAHGTKVVVGPPEPSRRPGAGDCGGGEAKSCAGRVSALSRSPAPHPSKAPSTILVP